MPEYALLYQRLWQRNAVKVVIFGCAPWTAQKKSELSTSMSTQYTVAKEKNDLNGRGHAWHQPWHARRWPPGAPSKPDFMHMGPGITKIESKNQI